MIRLYAWFVVSLGVVNVLVDAAWIARDGTVPSTRLPTPTLSSFETTASPYSLPCTFSFTSPENPRLSYNICPLLHRHTAGYQGAAEGDEDRRGKKPIKVDNRPIKIKIVEETPPTRTTSVYSIGLRGALEWDGTLPAELQCPKDTWICLIVENMRPSHPSEPKRRLQVIPVAGSPGLAPRGWLGQRKIPNTNSSQHILQYVLHGGTYTDRKQSAYFQFICDPKTKEPSEPTYLWRWNGTHTFEWKSRYACPTVHASGTSVSPPLPTRTSADEDGDKVPEEDKEENPINELPELPEEPVEPNHANAIFLTATVLGLLLLILRFSTRTKSVRMDALTRSRWVSGLLKVVLFPINVLRSRSPFRKEDATPYHYQPLGMDQSEAHRLEMVPLSPDSIAFGVKGKEQANNFQGDGSSRYGSI